MRDFIIRVHIEEPHPIFGDSNNGDSRCIIDDKKSGAYTVVISSSQAKRLKIEPFVIVAHEIGHILGHEFGLPRHVARDAGFTPGREINREYEAWDVALEMFEARKTALKTYRDTFRDTLL